MVTSRQWPAVWFTSIAQRAGPGQDDRKAAAAPPDDRAAVGARVAIRQRPRGRESSMSTRLGNRPLRGRRVTSAHWPMPLKPTVRPRRSWCHFAADQASRAAGCSRLPMTKAPIYRKAASRSIFPWRRTPRCVVSSGPSRPFAIAQRVYLPLGVGTPAPHLSRARAYRRRGKDREEGFDASLSRDPLASGLSTITAQAHVKGAPHVAHVSAAPRLLWRRYRLVRCGYL